MATKKITTLKNKVEKDLLATSISVSSFIKKSGYPTHLIMLHSGKDPNAKTIILDCLNKEQRLQLIKDLMVTVEDELLQELKAGKTIAHNTKKTIKPAPKKKSHN